MWRAFRPEAPLPWGEAGKGGFLWGRRLCGRPLTATLSRGERGKRGVPLKRLTPQPGPLFSAGRDRKTRHPNPLPQERDKSGASLRALTPHTVALPRTEGEELRGGGGLVWPGAGDRGRATRTPALSLKGEGERGVSWAQGGPAAEAGPGCEERLERKTLTPTLSHGEREKDAPLACQHGCSPAEGAGRRWFISGEGSFST